MPVMEPAPSKWLRRYFPAPDAAVRLVCFPHAGATASFYRPMAEAHSAVADVAVVQYPGRQDRAGEPFPGTIDDCADALAAVLGGDGRPRLPAAFFGHGMGALVAFEVAHRLAGTRHAPGSLIVSGRRAPGTVRDEQDDAIAELPVLDGTATEAARGHDERAVAGYPPRPDRVVDCPVAVLVGDDDRHTTVDEALRWKDHAGGPFRLRTFPGGHFFLLQHASAVNDEIGAELTALIAGR